MAEPILKSEPTPQRAPGAPESRRPRAVPHVHIPRPAAENAFREAEPVLPRAALAPEPPAPFEARRIERPVSRRALLIGALLALACNFAGLLPALRSPRPLDGGEVLLALVTLASCLVLLVLTRTGRPSPPRAR